MNFSFKRVIAIVSCISSLGLPFVTRAAAIEDLSSSSRPYQNWWGASEDESGILSFRLIPYGVSMHSFQDKDVGAPQITSVLPDPLHRRYMYISVRIDQKKDPETGGPFTTKVYRYDLETGKLTRIYRQAGGSGFNFLGFIGNKLIVVSAASGDNSPGPCWGDEVLASKTLTYIDTVRPWTGIKSFTPSAKFHAQRAKALMACEDSLNR